MSVSFNSRTEATQDDWQTPDYIVAALGKFDLDPCANLWEPNKFAINYFTEETDGLSQNWQGRVWLNPPYGSACKFWLAKLALHGNGIALIPPRMGSSWFQQIVLETADAIFFLKGRISFIDAFTKKPVKGNNADSIFVAFGEENVEILRNCFLEGKLWDMVTLELQIRIAELRQKARDGTLTLEETKEGIAFLRQERLAMPPAKASKAKAEKAAATPTEDDLMKDFDF